MARVVAVLLGLDNVPGATITRYCSSSVQTTRMAMHAIRAGEGDAFISAGVECVSAGSGSAAATPRRSPPTDPKGLGPNPYLDCAVRQRARPQRGPGAARRCGRVARPAGGRRTARLLHRHGPDRRERRRLPRRSPGPTRTSSRCGRRRWPRKALANGFWAKEITPVTLPDGTVMDRRRVPPRRRPRWRGCPVSSRCSRSTAPSPPATPAR